MILSDRDIKRAVEAGDITIDPFDPKNLQPASYDLHLDRHFLVFDTFARDIIDPMEPQDDAMRSIQIDDREPFTIQPKGFALGAVLETTGVSSSYVGRLEGKSSVGRLGLIIHTTAGYLDPGNCLHLTLELHNTAEAAIRLYYGMPIGQIAFEPLTSPCDNPYGSGRLTSNYKGDTMPKASQMYKNFNPETGEWK